jgi:hypothetical protein
MKLAGKFDPLLARGKRRVRAHLIQRTAQVDHPTFPTFDQRH